MAAVFLATGLFCAWNAGRPGIGMPSLLESLACRAATQLRGLIGALPFRSDDTAALVTAFLTGERSGLDSRTLSVFRASGASHVLALSGLHMGILYLLLNQLTHWMGNSPSARKIRFALNLTAAGFFTLMTGAGASVVRAFLFITINETLQLLNRPRRPARVLCLALLVQLTLDSGAIRGLGFQLSYLAMAGIFFLFPTLESWYPASVKWDPFRKIWTMAALSISCQLTTAPLVWLRFHTFPRYFLLTNLLAIPLVTVILATAVVTVSLSALGICPAFLYTATDGLCRLLLWVLKVISSL